MRRSILLMGPLAFGAITWSSVAFVGGYAGASPTQHITPGSVWTATDTNNGGCEVQTIGENHTWVADDHANGGDAGTYTGGAARVTETWTAGETTGQVFKDHWDQKKDEYKGSGSRPGFGTFKTTLVPGATPGCPHNG